MSFLRHRPQEADVGQVPPAGPSAQTWEQDVSVGGEDVNSNPAPVAQAVAVQGIATVRDVPALAGGAQSYRIAPQTPTTTTTFRVAGRQPQRRAIVVVAHSVTAATIAGLPVARINVDQNSADNGGLVLGHGIAVTLPYAGEVWAYCLDAVGVTVSAFACVDMG